MGGLDRVLRDAEAMSIRHTERHWSLIPPEVSRRVRPRVMRVADGLVTLMERSDSLRMNRVIGIGHQEAAAPGTVDEVIQLYHSVGLDRFSWLMSPGPGAGPLMRRLTGRGFRLHGGYSFLLRDGRRSVPPAP